jgi:Fe-Mn family superoxide dismutase
MGIMANTQAFFCTRRINMDTTRRDFITSTGAVGLLAASSTLVQAAVTTTTTETIATAPLLGAPHQPRPLAFDTSKLKGFSAALLDSHWSNNYGGAVKTLNAVQQQLAQALAATDTPPFIYNGLKREQLMRTGSVVLHELYFDNLGGNGQADADLRTLLAKHFGSFDRWETEFRKIGQGLAGGSGWVVLGYNTHFGTLENYWLYDHMHFPASTAPLLVMDMYEHAYQMDYGAAAAKYIDTFFQNIQWNAVTQRRAALHI